jgi:tetratricopeptide (TPR) repeat protein
MFQGKKDLFDTKVKRTLPMLLKNHEANPTDLHNLTHLVKQFYVMKQYDEVIEYGDAWMNLMRGAGYNEGWFSFLECFQQIAFAYGQKQDGENILRVIEECERYSHRVVPLYFVAGDFFATQGEQDRAAEYFEKGVKCYETEGSPYEALLTSNARMMLPEVLHWLAVHYFRNRQYATAGGYLNEAVRINDGRMQLRWDIWNEAVGKKNLVLEPKRSRRKAG